MVVLYHDFSRLQVEGGVVKTVYVISILDLLICVVVCRLYFNLYIIILHISYIPIASGLYLELGQIYIGQDAPPSYTAPLKPLASIITQLPTSNSTILRATLQLSMSTRERP